MRRRSWLRRLVLSLCLIGAVTAGLTAAQSPARPMPSSRTQRAVSPAVPRAFLDMHCVSCHSQRLKTAGLALDSLALDHVGADADVWEKVVRKLRTRAMPPAGRPRPEDSAYEEVAGFLEGALDRAASPQSIPARPTFHRLNRTEYGNAVRDLLGVRVDAESLLPADDASFGFDNIAEVLSVSPTLLERYLIAARRIARLAVGDPDTAPGAEAHTTSQILMQDDRMSEDLPFGSAGGMAVDYEFPLDGEYVVGVRLRRNLYGYVRGLARGRAMEVRVDGYRVAGVVVGGSAPGRPVPAGGWTGSQYGQGSPEWEDYMTHFDEGLQFRFAAKAGPKVIGVSFERNPSEPEGVLQPPITGFGYTADDQGNPAVDTLTISGPYRSVNLSETASRRRIFACYPQNGRGDEVTRCARTILTLLARRAYRRPVTAQDVDIVLAFFEAGQKAQGFDVGIRRAIERILVDPEFLFRIERDPAGAPVGSARRLTDLELASRLSFFLWRSIPDDTLLHAAARGQLGNPVTLEAQVRRMLRDERARTFAFNFVGQWLDLRKTQAIMPDPVAFPEFTENLRGALQTETALFVESQLREDRSVSELVSANYTYLNGVLARHYGIPNVYGSHFRRVPLSDDRRHGLLGQASVLLATSYGNRTSPVLRGKWLLENMLGTPPPPPPPNVPTLQERGSDGKPQTMRERLTAHRRNPVCATCHNLMDPLGFALENFDAVGAWRVTDEGGTAIDASGSLADGTQVNGPTALREHLLRHRDRFVHTFTEKLLTYALGRGLESTDQPAVRGILREAASRDFSWSAVVTGIVKSAPFQMRKVTGGAAQAASTVAPAGRWTESDIRSRRVLR